MVQVVTQRTQKPGAPMPQPLTAPNWFLGLVPRQYWDRYKTPFTYELDFATTPLANGGAVAANGTSSGNVQIQQDSHFLWVYGIALVTSTDNLTVINSASNANASAKLISLQDVGAGQPLANVQVPLDNWFGTAQLPMVVPYPRLFERGGAIGVTVTNLNTLTAHTVRLSFVGIRIFPDKPAE